MGAAGAGVGFAGAGVALDPPEDPLEPLLLPFEELPLEEPLLDEPLLELDEPLLLEEPPEVVFAAGAGVAVAVVAAFVPLFAVSLVALVDFFVAVFVLVEELSALEVLAFSLFFADCFLLVFVAAEETTSEDTADSTSEEELSASFPQALKLAQSAAERTSAKIFFMHIPFSFFAARLLKPGSFLIFWAWGRCLALRAEYRPQCRVIKEVTLLLV